MRESADSRVPLVVDLDGTLVQQDTYETMLGMLASKGKLWAARRWLARRRGKARLKVFLWTHSGLDVASLPLNEPLIAWLADERRAGRRLVLATGSALGLARAVAAAVGVFEDVIGTHGRHNLTGERKARVLVDRFGDRGFDYAGDAPADLAVWAHARRAVLVDVPPTLVPEVARLCEIEREFRSATAGVDG